MSHPQTDLETQKQRHKGPLIGMAAVLVFAGGLFVWWLTYEVAESEPQPGSEVQIDGRTGEPVEGDSLNQPEDGAPADTVPGASVPAVNAPAEAAPANPEPAEPAPAEPAPVE